MSAIGPADSIAADLLGGLPPLAPRATAAEGVAAVPFGDLFSHGLSQVNQGLLAGQTELQQLATGDVQNLHQIMVRLEENKVAFQLMMQVRNRLLEAYQDVMKMQI